MSFLCILASCGSMKTVSEGNSDPSIHFVKAWKPGDHPQLEVTNPPGANYNPLPSPKTAQEIAVKYATAMGVSINNIKNTRLYAFIDEWMGTPYSLGGISKMGIDCSGLVCLLEQSVYNAFGIPRTTNLQINYITHKEEQDLQEGDLVFFSFNSKPCSHVGVYLQNGYVLHASVSKGVTITHLHSPSMYKYYAAGGSIPTAYASYINTAGR